MKTLAQREQDAIGQAKEPSKLNAPNAITLGGFFLGAWWCAGGPCWAAVTSIVADEADGAIARRLDEESEFGADLDWTSDIVLTALCLLKLGIPWPVIPVTTTAQIAMRQKGIAPPVLSVRALLMIYGILKDSKVL